MNKRYAILLLVVLVMAGACTDIFSPLDSPLDPESPKYQGYDTVESPNGLSHVSPSNGATFGGSVLQVTAVDKAQAYAVRIATSYEGLSNPEALAWMKEDYSTNMLDLAGAPLRHGTWYYWQARALTASGWGNWGGQTGYSQFTASYSSTVALPVASPTPGTFTGAQSVSLSSATTGAVIRYTIDGTEPSPVSGSVYSTPINLPSSAIIKALAWKTGMRESAVSSNGYTIRYTVSFDAGEGASIIGVISTLVTTGGTYGTLPTASKVNHSFTGWWTGPGGSGSQVIAETPVDITANHTLYAKWGDGPYLVSYLANGATSGSKPADQSKVHDVNLSLRTNSGNLNRTGHTFGGWNTAADGSGTSYGAGGQYLDNAPITLYAKWDINTYTVTYNANNATGGMAPSAQTKTYGVALTLATNSGNLERTGYTFVGWNTAAAGNGTDYTVGGTYTTNANLNLYAKWAAKSFSVTFDSSGGTPPNPPSISVVFGNSYGTLANSSTAAGLAYKVFAGWWTGPGGTGTQITSSTVVSTDGNHILYAKWRDPVVGDVGPAGGIVFYDKGNNNDGWRWLETWVSTESGTYQWKTINTTTAGTSTAIGSGYANTYTAMAGTAHPAAEVCRNVDYGGYSDWYLPSKDELILLNQQRTVIGNFSAVDGNFVDYWSSSEGLSGYEGWAGYYENGYAFVLINTHLDLGNIYSHSKNSYARVRVIRDFESIPQIHFNNNGGTGYMPTQTPANGSFINLSTNTFTKFGCIFDGWNTQADGTGIFYLDGANYLMGNRSVVLYAQWRNTYEIGDTGPAGGIVFYINPESEVDGWRYLEAWTEDEGSYQWKTSDTSTTGTSTAIGTGYANTYIAMAGTAHPAAERARNATHGGYSDWFLPSMDELNLIYGYEGVIGGFESSGYWSSSETTYYSNQYLNHYSAFYKFFPNGLLGDSQKSYSKQVRVVRAF
jgi:uncharacterized repeat protein (TIGR02543 family)